MYREGRLDTYLTDAAAGHPTPGGGSVSALVGSLAAAMGEMSANFTIRSGKFAAVERTVREMLTELDTVRNRLLDVMDEDATAYKAVNHALKMPKDNEVQRASRKQALDGALRGAMKPPLEVMRLASRVSHIAARLVDIGNPNLITDVGVSAILADAACEAGRLNVEVNLKHLADKVLAKKVGKEMDGYCRHSRSTRDKVLRKVRAQMKQ